MPLPRIAIVGRPNVGKSSLLNRLARRRVSIVDPSPGVTRDRVSVVLELDPPLNAGRGAEPRLAELTDTGGFGVYTAEDGRFNEVGEDLSRLTPQIETQIKLAIEQSDLILLVIDAQAGLTSLDHEVARLLRQRGAQDRVITVANKVDGDSWLASGLAGSALGLGSIHCVSAKSGLGIRGLLDAIYGMVDRPAAPEAMEELKIAIVGKRNAGKSTLVNALAGQERVIVSEIAGTTRDAIDVRFELDGRRLLAIDTAGVRRRKSVATPVEIYGHQRMLDAIRRADVVLLLIDAATPVSVVDRKLAQELQDQFKPTVIAVSKWDMVDPDRAGPEQFQEYLSRELQGLDYAPIVLMSAHEQIGVREAVAMAFNLHRQAGHRIGTGELNRVVEHILKRRGPSSRLGTQAKLLYAAQVASHPPTLALVVNHPELFRGRYERYLLNRLREELPFSEVPIRLLFRARQRKDLQDVKDRIKRRKPPPVERR